MTPSVDAFVKIGRDARFDASVELRADGRFEIVINDGAVSRTAVLFSAAPFVSFIRNHIKTFRLLSDSEITMWGQAFAINTLFHHELAHILNGHLPLLARERRASSLLYASLRDESENSIPLKRSLLEFHADSEAGRALGRQLQKWDTDLTRSGMAISKSDLMQFAFLSIFLMFYELRTPRGEGLYLHEEIRALGVLAMAMNTYYPEANTVFFQECGAGLLLLVRAMGVFVTPLTESERNSVPALLEEADQFVKRVHEGTI